MSGILRPARAPALTMHIQITGVLFTASLFAQTSTWSQRPVTAPPQANSFVLAFDSARAVSVAYLSTLQQTWRYDGIAWSLQASAHVPTSNTGVVGCFDSLRHRLVIVVGNQSSSNLETWEWDGSDWTQRSSGGPRPRSGAAMAFDSLRGESVLFGGTLGNGGLADTWVWDGSGWQQVGSGGPLPRWGHAMTFDSQRGEVVLFGGMGTPFGNPANLADTWEWNGSYWHEHFGIAGPAARHYAALAFDSRRQRTVLYGGSDNNAFLDTWEWDGTSWQVRTPLVSPSTPGSGALAFDLARGVCVLYDGAATTTTWEYVVSGPSIASFTLFGQGCTGPAGVPSLAAVGSALPRLGATFVVRLASLPTSPFNLPFGVIGYDATSWNGMPLPVALDPFGFTGCQAWIAPANSVTLNNGAGVADWNIFVPLDLDLLGADFYLQGAVLVPGFNPGGVVFSNAGHGVVGV